MKNKETISWLVGKYDWAYKYLAEHNSKRLPQYEHKYNTDNADVIIGLYPNSIKETTPSKRNRTILHLDSKRVIGK